VSSSIAILPVNRNRPVGLDEPDPKIKASSVQGGASISPPQRGLAEGLLKCLPWVLYECEPSLELTFVSDNVAELIGFEPGELIGNRSLWQERMLEEDWSLVQEKLNDLNVGNAGSISMAHRLLDRRGLPVWVSHTVIRPWREKQGLWGCLLGMGNDGRIQGVEQASVDGYVHRIGNHFQLLRLVISSLEKSLPKSREAEVLHETVDNAIELTRRFSEYIQVPTCWNGTDMGKVLQAATARWSPEFREKGIEWVKRIDHSVETVAVSGDPFLLELAMSHILQNALESTERGGRVDLEARAEFSCYGLPAVKIKIVDSGLSIEEGTLKRIFSPFFSTKNGHDGLGLSMAQRFVKMHGGLLRVKNGRSKGTEVEVVLPATPLDVPFPR